MITFADPRKNLLKAYNAANNKALTLENVVFSDVRPVASIDPKPDTTANTAVTFAVKSGSGFSGETTLYYNRVSLATSFRYAPLADALAVEVTNQTTLHALLPVVNRRLGTRLTAEDVEDQPINMEWGFATVVLKAAKTSMTFTDELVLGLRLSGVQAADLYDIAYDIQPHTSSNAYTETANGTLNTKFNQSWRTYMFDYTPQAAVLKTYAGKEGPFQSSYHNTNISSCTTLANALKAVDGLPWTALASIGVCNLYSHWVMYNGPTADIKPEQMSVEYNAYDPELRGILDVINREYDNVMVIMLNNPWNGKDGWRESCVVHYNN